MWVKILIIANKVRVLLIPTDAGVPITEHYCCAVVIFSSFFPLHVCFGMRMKRQTGLEKVIAQS